MKGKTISKVLIILLALVMIFPLTAFTAAAEVTTNTIDPPAYIQDIYNNGRSPAEQAEYADFIRLMKMKEDSSKIESMFKEKKGLSKDEIKDISEGIETIRKSLPGMISWIQDAENGGDFDTAACVDNVISTISDIASLCGPYGAIASSVIDLGNTIFKLAMGGESATSEMAQMEDRLNQQLDDIQNQLSDIENKIGDLSNEINESTNTIINEVTSAIDNADAKAYLRTFMLSGEGNFSYNQYRNYIYGSSVNNSKANTAYYALLKQSINNDVSEEIVKYYYDQLYTSIMNNRDAYYDYVVGSDNSKSIVQYYYDVVSANSELIDDGSSAELMAIMFAYDIYQTDLMANQIISICNLYQYAQMCLSDTEYYCYDQRSGKIVTLTDIDGAEGIDSIQAQINIRIDEIQDQLACDIAYILNLEDSYIVESADGVLFEVVNNNPDTYANVLAGQTIYLNQIPEEVCDLFGFEANDFTYTVNVPTNMEGVFLVDSNATQIQASFSYQGKQLSVINFYVGTNTEFNGGNGTASDPYLIASAEQFQRISNGMDKHYRLICDIDFGNATIAPIGQRVNNNNAVVYDEFTGSFDGNGYTLSNLNVVGNTYTGLFGIVGESGEIADLKLYNVKASANITNAEKSTSEFYAGMIAGKNNGIIKYCDIDSDGTTSPVEILKKNITAEDIFNGTLTETVNVPVHGLFLDINNGTKNRNIYAYAGGITGGNNYIIACCTVKNVYISASSTHDFGGNKTNTNKNNVYVGGISGCNYGSIAYVSVGESTKITSWAKSIYNPETTVNPYVVAFGGGITAKVSSLSNIYCVESNAQLVKNGTSLDCQSKWGEHYNNCSDEYNAYIPGYSDDELSVIKAAESVEEFIAKTERNYVVTFDFGEKNSSGNYIDCIYEAGSKSFKVDNLKIYINGVEREYEIIDVYGFDAQNEEFNDITQSVVILFGVEIEGRTVYFTRDVSVIIEENTVTSIEVLNLKDFYVQDTFSLEGLVLKYNYAVGASEYITINGENISQFKLFGNITTFGEQNIALLYNGDTIDFTINVVCGHGNNFTSADSGYKFNKDLSKETSCSKIGYNAYVCATCGDIQYFYLRKTEHTPDYENAVDAKEVTCTEEGNTGKIVCIDCETVLIDGEIVSKLNHQYIYLDEDKHSCANGEHSEYHHYTITESVKQKINSDGSESWYIVYTYACVCQKDGKTFTKEIVDENLIIDANTKLPTIMVSDGYALSAGDEVTVYVQLINNPGVNAANFGIRYSEGLELISIQDGTVLKGSLVTDSMAVNYGYNFVWGNKSLFSSDGNLLKLTFKISEYAELGDEFDISLVYAIGNGAQGGFGTSNGKQYFITKDGTIKIVERLPGDINNDGAVDLLDAIEIGKFVVGKTDSIDEAYANVDLSYGEESNVDIMDMVAILQYITGGYGTNLLTQDFEIVLNTNGYNQVLNNLLVSIYGENNTYDEAGLAELERNGYKFLGWYDQMVGGNLIYLNGTNVNVKYNPNQKKQTLYAHWELNKLTFVSNGATSGEMDDVYYTDDSTISIENTYKKEYDVAFVSDNEAYSNAYDSLKYGLLYWEGSNGKQYNSLDAATYDLLNAHYGAITLKAVWSDSPAINYPEWLINGYETTVDWYIGTVSKTEIIPGVNNATILNASTSDGYYCVYSKHTPIVYDIVIDFNGGSGTVSGSSDNATLYGYSVEKTYDLSKVSVSNVGNAFTSWAVYVDGVYYKDFRVGETVGYLPNANQNSVITVKAVWKEKTYSIQYVLNGGSLSDSEKVTTYRISEVDAMNLPAPLYPTYSDYNKFVKWYVNAELTQEFDKAAIKTNPENITLYAKWDLCDVYYITNTPQNLTGNRVIVDWSSVANGTYNSNRTIYTENVSEVYFIGNPNTVYNNLVISSYAGTISNSAVFFHFDNLKFNGYLCKTDNSADIKVTLECRGKNSIQAPYGSNAIYGYNSLVVEGDGILTVRGYDGKTATTAGTTGEDGGVAILVDVLKVDNAGSLYVYGGNGSKGTDASGNGNSGGDGGNGALAVCAKLIYCINGTLEIRGGNGGSGGDGTTGTKGIDEGVLQADKDGTKNFGGKGGNGGNGGDGGSPTTGKVYGNVNASYGIGGSGGNGADGGKGGCYYNEVGSVWRCIGGSGGNGGCGGDGSVAGAGGSAGKQGGTGTGDKLIFYGSIFYDKGSGSSDGTSGDDGTVLTWK